jgi:hypothetical protein
MKKISRLLYRIGLPWASPEPKTKLDKYFNRRARVKSNKPIELNGTILDNRTLQILAGCPAGGEVIVTTQSDRIALESRHVEYIENSRKNTNTVEIHADTKGYYLYLDYIWFAKEPEGRCPPGLGPVALLRMAQMAQELGFHKLELLAAGGTGLKLKGGRWTEPFWGFSIWPRLGFDTPLQPVMLQFIKKNAPHLSNLTNVSEVIEKDRSWWEEHGDGWEMSFDLQEGSKSWQTLQQYLAEKGLTI